MSMLLISIIGVLTVLCEATWLHQVAIFEITPNLSLILVTFWSILQGSEHGRRLGLLVGLLQDFLFCDIIGFYGLLYYLLGHVSGFLKRDFHKGQYVLPLCIISMVDLAYGLVNYVFYCFFQGNLNLFFYIQNRIFPEICYTALISLPIYMFLQFILRIMQRWTGILKGGKEREF